MLRRACNCTGYQTAGTLRSQQAEQLSGSGECEWSTEQGSGCSLDSWRRSLCAEWDAPRATHSLRLTPALAGRITHNLGGGGEDSNISFKRLWFGRTDNLSDTKTGPYEEMLKFHLQAGVTFSGVSDSLPHLLLRTEFLIDSHLPFFIATVFHAFYIYFRYRSHPVSPL